MPGGGPSAAVRGAAGDSGGRKRPKPKKPKGKSK